MTDQTPALSALLAQQQPSPTTTAAPPPSTRPPPDSFLPEARQLNSRLSELLAFLRKIRKPYLSTARPSYRQRAHQTTNHQTPQTILKDTERDEIDRTMKADLRILLKDIDNLSTLVDAAANIAHALAQKRAGRSGVAGSVARWAAGGGALVKTADELEEERKHDTLRQHREAVVWFLKRKHGLCTAVLQEMTDVRERREEEKNKSALHKTKAVGGVPAWDGGMAAANSSSSIPLQERLERDGAAGDADSELNPAQMEMLTKENKYLLNQFQGKLEQVENVQRSVLGIAELQSTLAFNLSIQDEQINQLVADSMDTSTNVEAGNKQLKKASERKSTAKFVFWGTVGLCSVFVIWDLII